MPVRGTVDIFSAAARLLFACGLFSVCEAKVFNCTVTHSDSCTIYSIAAMGASGRSYSWAIGTESNHTVIAHEDGWKNGSLVKSANLTTLNTSECIPDIIYRQTSNKGEQHTATCTTTCPQKVVSPTEGKVEETSSSWIAILIAAVAILITVVAGVLICKSKKTCFYSSVKDTQTTEGKGAEYSALSANNSTPV